MAGVWTSEEPVESRVFFHVVSRDGVGDHMPSVAMSALRGRMDRGQRLDPAAMRSQKVKRAKQDIVEMAMSEPLPGSRLASAPSIVMGHRGPDPGGPGRFEPKKGAPVLPAPEPAAQPASPASTIHIGTPEAEQGARMSPKPMP